MNPAAFFEALVPAWRASLPPSIDLAYFDAFVARNRRQLEATLAPLLALLEAPTPSSRHEEAAEEARMGAALRGARDDEEAAWDAALRAGIAHEMTTNNLDRDTARRIATRNLAADLHHYDRVASAPADGRTKGERTAANLAAMQLVVTKSPGKFTASELTTLLGYSGWGGLSIDAVRGKFPPGLVPETFGLIHEYYTPTLLADAIADLVCPLLPGLASNTGVIQALEPSAGIGRLLRAFSARRCTALSGAGPSLALRWTAVEFSSVSSKLLAAVRPDVDLHPMPFERWIANEGSRHQGTFNLVVSNPPYGERGAAALEDTDSFFKEHRAYAYFMRRALDLLVAGGLGVFLVPAGFLTGNGNRAVREKLLLRHHLAAAFRLPSQTANGRDFVPGANVVMDLLVWRSRGGELTEVDDDDQFIVDGDYFERFPQHILGTVDGESNGEEEAGVARKGRWRYSVTGDFKGLPPLTERPLCKTCALGPIVHHEAAPFESVVATTHEPDPDDASDLQRTALALGRRVGRFLAAQGDDKAAELWPELHAALVGFTRTPALAELGGNPWSWTPLRTLADKKKLTAAQQLLSAFHKTGTLIPALAEPPKVEPRYQGRPDDVIAQAELLFRHQRALTIDELRDFHASVGGTVARADMLAQLYATEWNRDGDNLYPLAAYTTGNDLWDRFDRATARASRGDEQAAVQVRRLLDALRPAVFEDIADLNPQHGWVPLDLVSEWVSETLNLKFGPLTLERVEGLVQARGRSYAGLGDDSRGLTASTLAFLGYLNHDPELFKPPRPRRERSEPALSKEERAAHKRSIAEEREKLAAAWSKSFLTWLTADEDRRSRVTEAYNRTFRGRVVPTYSPEPLDIVRWGAGAPSLRPHQVSGARRILEHLRGLLAFDVGVGKTYTALAVLAYARQKGWVQRPVILVPSSLVWKWHDDILCTLPDYRVLVIGSKRKRITRGERKGVVTSETDTPEERAAKWVAFQTGQADVVVLSYDALGRTKMSQDAVVEYINTVEAVRRSINLRRRNLQDQKAEKLSERDKALLEHGVAAWVAETLRLPKGHQYDPGILWDDLGIDMLVVDEAAAFKNLYMPQAREDGVPKFMGSSGEGSHRAWQLDFRVAAVRRRTGGSGIVLLTATPAKNSPLEFYNILQFIDPTLFTRSGIHDPEQFIDRFLRIERRHVLDSSFNVAEKSAVVGFKNLDDLRTLIYTLGDFRSAADVGLKLPRPIPKIVTVTMDDDQEDKYSAYVAEIEDMLEHPDPNGRSSNRILGLLARLSLIALHPQLDEGYTFKTALTGGTSQRAVPEEQAAMWSERGWTVRSEPDEDGNVILEKTLARPAHYASPKFVECARRIAASAGCGHVVFCEPTATHQWIRETLVEHGIPRERIAILNAETAAPADRVRIAREFNGLTSEPPSPGTCARPSDTATAPLYDVLIVNSVANEGIDLQVRTCMLHHIDMTWTSADLEQRNGRGVRQGNTLGTVNIFYYFADRSMDGYRFDLINGKATWLADLLRSQARDTNNPAAQQQLTPEDILLMISRDKEKTQRMLDEKKKRKLAETRAVVAKEAARLLRQANGRFRDARASQSPERAAKLREEGEARLEELAKVDPEAWPWRPWMYAVRDTELVIPEDGSAFIYEGLRVARPRPGAAGQFEHLEFGRVLATSSGERIGLRAAGSPTWELVSGLVLSPEHFPQEGAAAWPDDDVATATALDAKIDATFRYGRGDLEALGWRAAADAWVDHHWPRVQTALLAGFTQSESTDLLPTIVAGKLALARSSDLQGELLPPSTAGWQRYLELAPTSGLKFTALKEAGEAWWERRIPNNLLSAESTPSTEPQPAAKPARVPEPAAAVVPEPATVKEPALNPTQLSATPPPSTSPPHEDAQPLAQDSEPESPTDDRLALWESTFANALAEFELPASTPLYALAHRTALAALDATDALLGKHGTKLTEALRVGGRKHDATIRSLERPLHRAFSDVPSEAARWDLISATKMLLEKTGRVSPPGPATEEFWRTWSAPEVLVLAKRRYQLRPHEVHFGRSTLGLRYGAGPGGDTPSLAVLRLQVSLPDRHGRATLIVTHLDGKRAMLQQTPPWTLTVPELEALTGEQIAARLNPFHGAAPLRDITWEEALVTEFEAQDPRDPQLRLERRLGSGLSIFAAYLPGPAPTPIVAHATITDAFEIEDLTSETARPIAELTVLRSRLEAALAVVARDFVDDEETSPPDYHAAHRAALTDPPSQELIARLTTQLGTQREEAALAALRVQARTDLGAASRMIASLAVPAGLSPTEIVAWLGEHDLEKSAALVSAYIFTPTIALAEFAADLASSMDAELGARRMRATAKPPLVPRAALRRDPNERPYILEATGTGVRRHVVQELADKSDAQFVALGPAKLLAAMQPTPRVYADELIKDATIERAWQSFDTLLRRLADAPTQLEEARQLLAAAAVLADSPKCQGQAKENALRALAHARDAHEAAREQLARGRDARAIDRLQQALRQIAEVAHQSAASCGAGQGALIRDEFKVPTLPETAANMNGEV